MNNGEKTVLAKNLIRFRKQMGLTQLQISDAVGIERSRYAHYEKDTTPTTDILRKLASILNVTMDELHYTPEQIQQLHDSTYSPIDGFPFNELKNEEKELIMKYRLLSADAKDSVIKFISEKLDKEDDQ